MIKELLKTYKAAKQGACECTMGSQPCKYCSVLKDIKEYVAKDKYLRYMVNLDKGEGVPFAHFLEDWEPIGPQLLDSMTKNGEVIMKDMTIRLVDELYDIVGG